MPVEPNKIDQLRAAVLNALAGGISPGTQQQVLSAPTGAERFGAGLAGLGQSVASVPQSILQAAQPTAQSFARGLTGQTDAQPQKDKVNSGVATPEILQQIEQIEKQKKDEAEKSKFIQRLVKLGVPLTAAIAGTVSPGILPEAAGFAGGFVGEGQRQEELGLEQQRLGVQQANEQFTRGRDIEKEATDLALASFKDAIKPPSAEDLLARRQEILDRIKGETSSFQPPEGAPNAADQEDGTVLKQDGKVVAIARGGRWVSP